MKVDFGSSLECTTYMNCLHENEMKDEKIMQIKMMITKMRNLLRAHRLPHEGKSKNECDTKFESWLKPWRCRRKKFSRHPKIFGSAVTGAPENDFGFQA